MTAAAVPMARAERKVRTRQRIIGIFYLVLAVVMVLGFALSVAQDATSTFTLSPRNAAIAVPKFAGLPEVYLGVNIARLVGDLRDFVQPVLDLPRDAFEPGKSRGVKLPVDLKVAPKIELEYEPFEEGSR